LKGVERLTIAGYTIDPFSFGHTSTPHLLRFSNSLALSIFSF
jgi:hypothetical protein